MGVFIETVWVTLFGTRGKGGGDTSDAVNNKKFKRQGFCKNWGNILGVVAGDRFADVKKAPILLKAALEK